MPECMPPVPNGCARCVWCRQPIADDPDYVLVASETLRLQWWHMACRDELFRLEAAGLVPIYSSPEPASP